MIQLIQTLTLDEVDCLLLENCKIGWKAGSLWNKEQGGREEKIADWPEPHGQACLGESPELAWHFGDQVTGSILHSLVKWSATET